MCLTDGSLSDVAMDENGVLVPYCTMKYRAEQTIGPNVGRWFTAAEFEKMLDDILKRDDDMI